MVGRPRSHEGARETAAAAANGRKRRISLEDEGEEVGS